MCNNTKVHLPFLMKIILHHFQTVTHERFRSCDVNVLDANLASEFLVECKFVCWHVCDLPYFIPAIVAVSQFSSASK